MSHSIVLASAQFPVPIGEAHLGDWQSVGVHGQFVHDSDRPLVVVNQGKEGDEGIGFDVCDKCGAAAPVGSAVFAQPRHQRPYLVDWGGARQQPIRCDGTPRTVFLGTTFTSDLLLLRTNLAGPLGTNMQSSVTREALEDSLRTLSEAILLAASRVLDIDPAELNCGFRIVPDEADDRLRADIYLFDTLSGGAGYADQAGHHMEIILDKTLELLEQCPGDCTHSCQECLRHYANQY